ncbi:hypothetical protein RyT2_07400 [Pseudolactococcus yaeyamensis]
MSECITIGEPLVDIRFRRAGFAFGLACSIQNILAGAELNIAIGLAHLGYDTAYVAKVGQDSLGNFIKAELEKSGIGG